jgi:aldose 1-epimerase
MLSGMRTEVFTLKNAQGVEVQITNFGARVISIKVPDRQGRFGDVVLGFDSLASYQSPNPYFGGIVGRFANRIAKGKFTIAGVEHQLATNDRDNHLHGGRHGFDNVVWAARFQDSSRAQLELTHESPDGDEGYPGTLLTNATYSLSDDNGLEIDIRATTDKPTVVNLANHSYFNLSGDGAKSILDHELLINADRYTPTDVQSIPTGELESVAGTPFDFRVLTPVGSRISEKNDQLVYGLGYDHNWVLNKNTPDELSFAAKVIHPASGRQLEVLTTEPGIQFYSGNQLDGTVVGKGGLRYAKYGGFCLETQHFPDAPNQPSFPSSELHPGQEYHHRVIYRFSVTKL